MSKFREMELPKSLTHKLDGFPQMSVSQKQTLLQTNEHLFLSKKHFLFTEGEIADSFFLVLKGAIKLVKILPGEEHQAIVDIVMPGEMIGSVLMLDEKASPIYPLSAMALIPSEVLQISKSFYHSYWKKYPNLLEISHQQMVKRIQKLQLSQSIQRLSVEKRLAFILTELIGPHYELQITRKELSDWAGTSTESVIRIMSRWEKEQLLSTKNKNLELLSIMKLRELWQS